jgi:hypothetical protein
MPSLGSGYGDRRRDRSEGTIRAGSVWPIRTDTVNPIDELLLDAAMRCDLDELNVCIDCKANPAADANPALNIAASHGGTLVVGRLAELGASVNKPGAFGKTPLIAAAEKGHADVVQALVAAGADLDAGLVPGGQSALHLVGAEMQCPLQMARVTCHVLLESHADILLRDRWGRTAEQFHRKRAALLPTPNPCLPMQQQPGGDVNGAGSGAPAPLRDGRSLILADMIAKKLVHTSKLVTVMQRLCWMRLLRALAHATAHAACTLRFHHTREG